MGIISLRLHHRSSAVVGREELNREALVVAEGDAFEVVEGEEGARGDGVELAVDAVVGGGGGGEVEEEGDTVGAADEGEGVEGVVVADEVGVV
ncbi:hypothetical protein LOK49_LG11G02153 [Camellia lanceoleosa]|uniref:Uncharacterized protein n=1 Tax=Camellia lanceoleosa TaxID=1840588 RepID=A0ACC0G5E0_9ERIC|nr:hypothetical protein LOK49_LG11G02153 [Camellia lanceoleosa]